MYRIVSPSRPSAALSFTKVWAREGVSERRWRSAANRSPLPLRSVLDAPHRGAGPEPAGETGVGSCPGVIFSKGGKPPLCIPPTGESTPPYPLLRGGAPVSAAASVGPGRCPPGTRPPLAPPRACLALVHHFILCFLEAELASPYGGAGAQWAPFCADRTGRRDSASLVEGGAAGGGGGSKEG